MKESRFYKISTLVLLIINIGLITFFIINKPKHPPMEGNTPFQQSAKNILHLTEEQDKAFVQLANQHMQLMRTINKDQADLLKPHFSTILNDSSQMIPTETLEQFSALERKKVVNTYQHFLDIKDMLTPEQMPHFKHFMNQAVQRILLQETPDRPMPSQHIKKRGQQPPPPPNGE